jgi:hypothetical protein
MSQPSLQTFRESYVETVLTNVQMFVGLQTEEWNPSASIFNFSSYRA